MTEPLVHLRRFCLVMILATVGQGAALILLAIADAFFATDSFEYVFRLYAPMELVINQLNLCQSGGWDMLGCWVVYVFLFGAALSSFLIASVTTFLMFLVQRVPKV